MRFGLKLMSELRDARTLVDQAQAAEDSGFEFVAISDHFHPWLSDHEHSPFAWSVLGAVAAKTRNLDIATGLTCPIIRYHPAIIAQAAATLATMTDRQFVLAVGAGEKPNEHITGANFPAVDIRHEMLGEAIRIMRALWTGEWTTIRGDHLTVEDDPATTYRRSRCSWWSGSAGKSRWRWRSRRRPTGSWRWSRLVNWCRSGSTTGRGRPAPGPR